MLDESPVELMAGWIVKAGSKSMAIEEIIWHDERIVSHVAIDIFREEATITRSILAPQIRYSLDLKIYLSMPNVANPNLAA